MKRAAFIFSSVLLIFLSSTAQEQKLVPTLKIGDIAPPIVVNKWVKGKPIKVNNGKVVVVEFWATWCGPCKFGMPHVSNLAKKYKGKAEFAGISIWEKTNDYMPELESYVRHANEAMDYNVAAGGGEDAPMSKTYMQAVGASSIPYVFVIDKRGKLAWHGHPMNGLDKAVALAVEDKLTPQAAAKINEEIERIAKLGSGWRDEFLTARSSDNDAKVLELADKIVNNLPHMGGMVIPYQYVAYANTNPAGAVKFGEKLLSEYYNAPMLLQPTARMILDEKSRISGKRDYALAVRLLRQTEKVSQTNAGLKEQLAKALFLAGDIPNAIKEQKAAVAMAREELAKAEKQEGASVENTNRQTQAMERAERTLDQYSQAAKTRK